MWFTWRIFSGIKNFWIWVFFPFYWRKGWEWPKYPKITSKCDSFLALALLLLFCLEGNIRANHKCKGSINLYKIEVGLLMLLWVKNPREKCRKSKLKFSENKWKTPIYLCNSKKGGVKVLMLSFISFLKSTIFA